MRASRFRSRFNEVIMAAGRSLIRRLLHNAEPRTEEDFLNRKLMVVMTAALIVLSSGAVSFYAQSDKKTKPAARSAEIDRIVREISAQNIDALIKKLVSFRTRHSLSDPTSETEGIGAARRWIKSEFDRYSKE